ncbi:MAG: hypothetical protein ACLQGJ_07055 [Candidatus Dormibacteria bacterium]
MAERLKLQGARFSSTWSSVLNPAIGTSPGCAPPAIHSYRDLVKLVDRLRDTKLSDMEATVPLTFVATWPTQMRQAPAPPFSKYCW